MKVIVSITLFVFACLIIPEGIFCASGGDIVATGDGFVLTREDVAAIKDYYENSAFRTTGEEYQKAALKIKLFAREAIALNLDKGEGVSTNNKSPSEIEVILAGLYFKYIVRLYPVSDLVIESYYRTFPERFSTNDEQNAGKKFLPMDDSLKQKVRTAIINVQKKKIISEVEGSLKSKYHVKVY